MKRLYIIFSLALGLSALAQNKDTEKADKLYNRFEYLDAAAEYQKLAEDGHADPYVYRQLAESHYNVFNSKEAVRWYAKATETDQQAEIYYHYAQMLKAEGQYEAANAQMRTFAAKAPGDQRAIIFKADPDYLPKLRAQAKLFDAKSLEINSDKADFGAVLSNDGILYFASARNEAKRKYGWNEEPFLDLYQSVRNTDGTLAKATPVSGVNGKFHDGPAAISADGNTMYFSSESFREGEYEKEKINKDRQKRSQVYLYKATKNGGGWDKITDLPFNSKDFSTGNPSISKDGRTLYFASDRPGSLGGSDIWKVSIGQDGGYGEPQNLGDTVNTEGQENFPYITDDGKLYFASQGRKGFGGYDVFVIEPEKGGQAKNLGAPVNTNKDDFAFTYNDTKKVGFFSSNREGNDNIFLATPVCSTELITTVRDAKTLGPLADARVSILDDRRNVIETRTSGADGRVSYTVDCGKAFTIQATRDGYESGSFPASSPAAGGTLEVPADLQPIETIVGPTAVTLNEIYFEYDKSNITREGAFELDKLVQAMGKYPDMAIMVKSHTDNRGTDAYNMALSERRAKSTVQYILSKGVKRERISGKGYGEAEPKVACGEGCTEEQHAQNRRSEFIIVKGAEQP
jgi:outer membrane protein OmpA-like peptidoglycan-associated protein/tetratricopeptide (TPR) repeat protein